MTAPWNPATWRVTLPTIRLRRLMATSAFALISLAASQPSVQAQALNEDEICFAIADNNPPGVGSGGGSNQPDTLSRIDNFLAGQASAVAQVTRESDGTPISDIEALTSRPEFGELIAANANEIGRIDPVTGIFTSIGFIEGFRDFDAIVIDRNSPDQRRLIAVSKGRVGSNPSNTIVQIDIVLDDQNQQAIGLDQGSAIVGPVVDLSQFPASDIVTGIDGIAISPGGIVYGVANGGPTTAQKLISINLNTGATSDLGDFTAADGTLIEDVEDISFDLTNGILFATSGSNFSDLSDNAFLFDDPQGGQLGLAQPNNFNLRVVTGAIDYEASACIRAVEQPPVGSLLLVKRITAVTQDGEETRYDDDFTDQAGDQDDNLMRDETDENFPVGLVEAPDPLSVGDLVEYTIYLYNPTDVEFENVVLCDPLQLPSILQRDSINPVEFSVPRDDLNINFTQRNDFAERPLAAADDACLEALDGEEQFRGTNPNGPGGGVVTDSFSIGPGQISATRFVVEVGQLQSDTNSDTDTDEQ
ncbi:MAG: hypothetical protein AAGM45_14760 [Cyanobacteria bacterium J06588_5]